ncbi:uncharacterized protein EHS24_004248 [Apiotrichum porosum]|uniref:Uncharacterized protein n=1 Tax=Apiotrichum porosum TaxID=105984 RepID=A0A427Y4N2_9TREE|nr:uncharacterized protein EHS24_004248 [Apiotrichum porosum]RSH86044.1 hypothetical protein EHS24_004248 [Apiotrichum porosum]
MLDAACFPHLVDLVFEHALYDSLLALRTASKSFRQAADDRLIEEIIVSRECKDGESWCYVFHPYGGVPALMEFNEAAFKHTHGLEHRASYPMLAPDAFAKTRNVSFFGVVHLPQLFLVEHGLQPSFAAFLDSHTTYPELVANCETVVAWGRTPPFINSNGEPRPAVFRKDCPLLSSKTKKLVYNIGHQQSPHPWTGFEGVKEIVFILPPYRDDHYTGAPVSLLNLMEMIGHWKWAPLTIVGANCLPVHPCPYDGTDDPYVAFRNCLVDAYGDRYSGKKRPSRCKKMKAVKKIKFIAHREYYHLVGHKTYSHETHTFMSPKQVDSFPFPDDKDAELPKVYTTPFPDDDDDEIFNRPYPQTVGDEPCGPYGLRLGATSDKFDSFGFRSVGDKYDLGGDEYDLVGNERDLAIEEHDRTGDEHDLSGNGYDLVGDEHALAGNERDLASEEHDRTGDEHDLSGNEYDLVGDEHALSGNEHDLASEEHDWTADNQHSTGEEQDSSDEYGEQILDRTEWRRTGFK